MSKREMTSAEEAKDLHTRMKAARNALGDLPGPSPKYNEGAVMYRYETLMSLINILMNDVQEMAWQWEREEAEALRPLNAAALAAEARRGDDDDHRPARQHPEGL